MHEQKNKNYPRRAIENIAIFGGAFLVGQVAGYVGDQIHDPQVTDVPRGAVIAAGLVVAGIVTNMIDSVRHR